MRKSMCDRPKSLLGALRRHQNSGANWTAADMPDQSGRVAIVTGGNSGLGYATAKALADHGAHVVLAVRDVNKGRAAARRMSQDNHRVDCTVQRVDLAALTSVREAAEELKARHPRIDLLINNAGVCWTPYMTTADGFELQFGTNHLGHFALTGLLLETYAGSPKFASGHSQQPGPHVSRLDQLQGPAVPSAGTTGSEHTASRNWPI